MFAKSVLQPLRHNVQGNKVADLSGFCSSGCCNLENTVWTLGKAQANAIGIQKASSLLNNDSRCRVNKLLSFGEGKRKANCSTLSFSLLGKEKYSQFSKGLAGMNRYI